MGRYLSAVTNETINMYELNISTFGLDVADWREFALDARLEARGFTPDQRNAIHEAVREQAEDEARALLGAAVGRA